MTFEEMLDQAIAMLQRRGRLTYRTLQRQFHLDDDALNDLKDALLYAHPEVRDDEGRGLVWTGESSRASQRALAGLVRYYGDAGVLGAGAGAAQREGRLSYRRLTRICAWTGGAGGPPGGSPLPAPGPRRGRQGPGLDRERTASWPGSRDRRHRHASRHGGTATGRGQHPTRAPRRGSRLAEPPRPEAERRQVTVMFCDLVASTELSQQLDPEDYRAVVRAYQAAAAAALQPYDGYIAQYLGDGLLVYFGWPQAHEDAAHRAVHASLALLDALGPLHETHLVPHYGVHLAVRIGLHTGMAVIGEMGGGDRYEQLAMGDTPNLAARIRDWPRPIRWHSVPPRHV
jgi:class 3 adenylate cyclase